MEGIAEELGVPVEVLLRGLPPRLRHAADGVILRRFARLGCHADFLRVRDPLTPDVMRPEEAFARVRGHLMPYMTLEDAAAIYRALREEEGPATSHHREVVITNREVLLAKYDSYRSIVEQADLLDRVSVHVEEALTLRLQAQFQTSVADLGTALTSLREHAWRMVFLYLREGVLSVSVLAGPFVPGVSQQVDIYMLIAILSIFWLSIDRFDVISVLILNAVSCL
uniref:Uncharacterized protein n=1 Tax=Aegilops tauschii TaxID=37682 RepID=R7WDR2_AEGTA